MAKSKLSQEESEASKCSEENPSTLAVSTYLNDLVNRQDLVEIIDSQNSILSRFEKTNETLTRVNSLSEIRYDVINKDFRRHISTLLEMKQNLDTVFRRIRTLRNTVRAKYPEAYKENEVSWVPPDDSEEEVDTPTDLQPQAS